MQQDNNIVLQSNNLPGPKAGEIVVNEVAPDLKQIEFYNTSDHDISLVGCVWKGVDEENKARPDYIISNTNAIATISSNGFGVMTFKTNDDTKGPTYGLSGGKKWYFTLTNADGEDVIKDFTNVMKIDGASYNNDESLNVGAGSFGRITDGAETWKVFEKPTIGLSNSTIIPDTPDVPSNDTKLTVHTSYDSIAESLSGLTFNKDKTLLYGVGDKGTIYSFDLSKETLDASLITYDTSANIGETTANGRIGDFEAITYCSQDDKFYILNEKPAIIYTFDTSTRFLEEVAVFEDGDNIGTSKNGFEGLTYYEKKKFFIGHQETAGLYKFNLKDEPPILKAVDETNLPLLKEHITEIADLYFDGTNIWVLDSKECSIVKCDNKGAFISKYTLPFLSKGDNPEALAIDITNKIAYVGCDNGDSGNTKCLFKVLLNEVSSDKTIVMNEFDPGAKKLELYNCTDNVIDLNGYTMYKDDKLEEPFIFDSTNLSTIIDAKSRLVIPVKVKDESGSGPTFGMSDDKGFDYKLFDTNNTLIDHVDNLTNITVIKSGMSYGRKTDASDEFVIFSTPSIGEPNDKGTVYVPEPDIPDIPQEDIEPGDSITDHIVINEVKGGTKEIELYNPTDTTITMTDNYAIIKIDENGSYDETYQDDKDSTIIKHGYWIFKNSVIAPKEHLVIVAGGLGNGPSFGINLTKKIILKLYAVTSSTDYSSLDTINATATLVDEINNYDDFVAVKDKNNDTIGRVNDGTTNICFFSGGTIGKSNNDGVKYAKKTSGGDTPTPSAKKEVAYWVPVDSEYIYYPIFYDNDTILSLNNTGMMKIQPNVESTDTVGTGYAYNGTESVLWMNLKDAFANRISELYAKMRNSGLTYANCLHFFTDTQSKMWSESVYNMDAKFKYFEPCTIGYTDFSIPDADGNYGVNAYDNTYLYECQGSRESHRAWWLNNRFNYMDSRYNTGQYADSYITTRLYTPTDGNYNTAVEPNSTFHLTPYTDMYLRIRFGSRYGVVRAEKNKTYAVASGTTDKYNDTETIIYGAPYLLSLGDMADKYLGTTQLGNASRITEFIIGHDRPYYNDNIKDLSFTINNTALKYVDVRNCRKLATLRDLDKISSIETVLASNTSLTSIILSDTGCNLKRIDYPASLSVLKLVNMPYITNSGITFESLASINSVWIEKCDKLNVWNIISNILSYRGNLLSNIRLSGINWNITTSADFEIWNKLLALRGMNANGNNNSYDMPYISGKVNFGSNIVISTGYKESITSKMKNITGADLIITGGKETSMSGIQIAGPSKLTPNVWYKFEINYLPDNYVKDEEKGVKWTLPEGLEIRNQNNDSVEMRYVGSASGSESFELTATSTFDPKYTSLIYIKPQATLSFIRFYDETGKEMDYNSGISFYEGEKLMIHVEFDPADTADTAIDITTTNDEYFSSIEYDENNRVIYLTSADVNSLKTTTLTVRSKTVPGVSRSIMINIKNIVSRIIHLVDDTEGNGTPMTGYIDVTPDPDTSNDIYRIMDDDRDGIITLPTNGDYDPSAGHFQFKKLKIQAHLDAENTVYYNQPDEQIIPALAETATNDEEYTFNFYKPVDCKIKISNGGSIVNDAYFKIFSIENNTIRTLLLPPYNNVIVNPNELPDGYSANIKLLADTVHHLQITQCDKNGNTILKGKKYSDFTGTFTIGYGTESQNIDINVSRDYLSDAEERDATDLMMTVVTGSDDYKVIRIYYEMANTYNPKTTQVVVNWGDKSENPTNYLSTLESTTSKDDTGNVISSEKILYHVYKSNNKEYDIKIQAKSSDTKVSSDTQYIRWFHVLSKNDNYMKPCFGKGNVAGNAQFSDIWTDGMGGLVAYQTIGNAKMNGLLRFNFKDENYKKYSKLISIGNIYKKNKGDVYDMTSADDLFANSTLEQISNTRIFNDRTNIKSFVRTFKNTNLTSLNSNFFEHNVNATDFTETFAECGQLVSIQSTEDNQFLFPGDDIEIRSVKNMFINCSSLTDEAPAFWKTFYGCSFANAQKNQQMTFAGDTRMKNYNNIPKSWGGRASEYVSDDEIELEYIKLPDSTAGGYLYADFGTYEFEDISLSQNYKYVIDIFLKSKAWETTPIFGGAIANDNTNLDTITNVVDLCVFGKNDGSLPQTNDTFSVMYRTGNENTSGQIIQKDTYTKFNYVLDNQDAQYKILDGLLGKRITIDICKSNPGEIVISDSSMSKIGYMPKWSLENTKKCNVPLRLFASYMIHMNNAHPSVPVASESGTSIDETILNDNNTYIGFLRPAIYSFKIYDSTGLNLIHDLRPVYAVVNGSPSPLFKDYVTNKYYMGTGRGVLDASYYIKNKK